MMEELKNPNEVRAALNELSDDDLDAVAGGCGGNGNGKGHGNSNGKGHQEHGKGWGKGHDKCGCGDHEEDAGDVTLKTTASMSFTCPYCGQSMMVADITEARAHMDACPSNPCL